MVERYPASAARTRNGSRIGRPRTNTCALRPAGLACDGRWQNPVTSTGPSRYAMGSSVSASSRSHSAWTRSMRRSAGGASNSTRPSLVSAKATSGRARARRESASLAARVADLAGGVTLQGEARVVGAHAFAVVAHPDQRLAAILELHANGAGARV